MLRPLIQQVETPLAPEELASTLRGLPGTVALRSALFGVPHSRYSLVAAKPFLSLKAWGARCELLAEGRLTVHFGNPWRLLDDLMARYEVLDEVDAPFPLGACLGYWGYDLKNFVEPRLRRHAVNDLELPDCHLGFYDSLVVFDHVLNCAWIISTGLQADGSRSRALAEAAAVAWRERLRQEPAAPPPTSALAREVSPVSNFSRDAYLAAVRRAQEYIRQGDIYQVNLAQRFAVPNPGLDGLGFFQRLLDVSPSPFAAYVDCGEVQLASSSPEMFLRLSGRELQTRPIKGTRPRSADPQRDAQLAYELQTSPKETAELIMITDLLRNDLGRVSEFGSVRVPELFRLERYPQVQHLVSTVEGRLRPDLTHVQALEACFPGGSITGAPKFRAMEIIEELEPATRGPYTGCLGYLGFNQESELSIIIRTALCAGDRIYYHAGAGIVADSIPEAEYDETLAKAQGFFAALQPKPARSALAAGHGQPTR